MHFVGTIIAYLRHAARSTRPTARHRHLTQWQQTNHYIAMRDVVICLLIFCCSFALFRCESQAHTDEAAGRHRVVVTIRYAAASSEVAPATTAQHAESPTRRSCRICLRPTAVTAIPVITPLIHIAAHVVQSKYIRCLTSNFVCA